MKIRKLKLKLTVQQKKNIERSNTMMPTVTLFIKCLLEQAIRDIKQKLEEKRIGIIIGGILISMIRFKEDIVLLATSEKDLQTALTEMDNLLLTLKLNIKMLKTKMMV